MSGFTGFSAKVTGSGQLVAQLQGVARTASDTRALLQDAGYYMSTKAIPTIFRTGGGPAQWPAPVLRDGKPLLDTGVLRNSISYGIRGARLTIGSHLEYSALQQWGTAGLPGGVLKPKKGKFLAIPNPYVLKPSERQNRRPRDFPNAFFNAYPFPALWLKKGKGKNAKIVPIFFLHRWVRIRARPFLFFTDEHMTVMTQRWTKIIQIQARRAA